MIDEVTIWNRALSAAEIRDMMCRKLTGTESGLVAYWRFDERSGCRVYDLTSNDNDGWVFNEVGQAESGGTYTLTDNDKNWAENSLAGKYIALIGGTGVKQMRLVASNTAKTITVTEAWETVPNSTTRYALTSNDEWCTSTAPVGDGSAIDYTGSNPEDFVVNLSHDDGDGITVTGTGGSFLALQAYLVDETPDNLTAPAGWNENAVDRLRYWGVFVVHRTLEKPQYTIQYNYSGHPFITDESSLGLGYRSGPGAAWSDLEAVLDTENNTLTKSGQTGTEYVLLNNENPIAVSLVGLEARAVNGNTVSICWTVEEETGVAGYAVYRSRQRRGDYIKVSSHLIPVQADAAFPRSYRFQDASADVEREPFYKVQAIHLDGSCRWFGPVQVAGAAGVSSGSRPHSFRLEPIRPNPFNPQASIAFELPEAAVVTLAVYDVSGRQVATVVEGQLPAGSHEMIWNAADLPSGIYFVCLKAGGHSVVQRALLLK